MTSDEMSTVVFTYTFFEPVTRSVRTGATAMSSPEAVELEKMLHRLGAADHSTKYRYGNDTNLSNLVRYEDYEALSPEYGAEQVRRAYFALVRYALRNPDQLNAVCPVCRRHISKRCGEYTTERIDWQLKPYIGLASLIALHAKCTQGVVRGYGPKSEAVTEAVIKYVQAGREA